MKGLRKQVRIAILICAVLLLSMCFFTGASAEEFLSFPEITETDCVWDENGNLINETAHDLNGAPAINRRGFFRAVYTWDSHGNMLSESYYGLNGEPVTTDKGYARAQYTYFTDVNNKSHILTEDRYAEDGGRADISGEYSYRRDEWDQFGMLSSRYFNANGELTRPSGGYAQILCERKEEDGQIIVIQRYQDADGSPLTGTEGGEVIVSAYSSQPFLLGEIEVEHLDYDMMIPVAVQGEDSAYVYLLMSRRIYTADDHKVLGTGRWFHMENTYDSRANLLRTDYYGTEDEPILASSGYASVVHVYDDRDRTIETDYLDVEGTLTKVLTGYAKVTFEYYENDRIHYETYYGADDQRTMTTYGYSMAEYEYYGDHFDWRVTYYDTVDEYTMCLEGFARQERIFQRYRPSGDEGGLWALYPDIVTEERYYGTDLQLIPVKAGHAGRINEVNGSGQILKTIYMDVNWQPVRNDEVQYASIV